MLGVLIIFSIEDIIMKKEEANDIHQFLLPKLDKLGIQKENLKIDVTTQKSGNKRGDIWISKTPQQNRNFEKDIIALIEAKHRNSTIGDMEWRDAMKQGKEKAIKQKLNYYIVTNCKSETRFYNAFNDEEVELDGKVLTDFVFFDVLNKIQTQISEDNSHVIHKASKTTKPFAESKFRSTLKNLADIYRSAGLKKGDDRIDPTISFVVIKYISEKENEKRTLDNSIKLWGDIKDIAYGKITGDLRSEFNKIIDQIWGKNSEYKDNVYRDFNDLIIFPTKLKNEHFKKIYIEIDKYHFHGANFDLFGSIYEEFASQTKKKEFGEFYTRRHITKAVTDLLLRKEEVPRDFKVCDPACGSGGFLTEAYQTLLRNYSSNNKLNKKSLTTLQTKIFYGYDNDAKSVARTKLNMFLVGDGHINIYENDSLVTWKNKIGYEEDMFDYAITNPPMGKYDGDAKIEDFDFTNEKRYELLFAEKVVGMTKPGGEIAIVLNDGALEAPTRERFRRKLLENCNIYAVVSLTKFAFAPYTKEKTYVLFMQKKQADAVGEMQKIPIWHFVVDYDGYANSDKRYRTKYHEDFAELRDKFPGAIKLSEIYPDEKKIFNQSRSLYERDVNDREKEEGLTGKKYGFVAIENVNDDNFFNLLSEFHLRPYKMKRLTKEDFANGFEQLLRNINFNG